MTPLVEVIEIVRMEQDFSHFTWTSAWVDFGHVLANDIQDTDRISDQNSMFSDITQHSLLSM